MREELVSVIVPTYNHEKFVVECLESVKAQDYKNIELIVADDHSSDRTVEKIDMWLSKNRERFAECKIIVQHENSGTTGNLNSALRESGGTYIKFIAGDDLLHESALKELVSFASSRTGILWVSGRVIPFIGTGTGKKFLKPTPSKRTAKYFSYEAETQFRYLCIDNFVRAAGVFFRRDAIENGFDETYRILEDYPTWLKLTQAGHPVRLLEKTVAYWRRHTSSTSISAFEDKNRQYFKDNLLAIQTLINPNIDRTDRFVIRVVKLKEEYITKEFEESIDGKSFRSASKLNRLRKKIDLLMLYDFLRNFMRKK